MAFDFKTGDPIRVNLIHMQSVELFCEQFLSALNYSLLEAAGVPLPDKFERTKKEDRSDSKSEEARCESL